MPVSWSAAQAPLRLFANVYYVGTRGISALLLTSDAGHVLIDGTLGSTAPLVMANIRGLGFRIEDIRLIVNSHAHYDHAGGIALIQRASGARVAALTPSARVMESGRSGPDDPQFGVLPAIEPVKNVSVIRDGETLRVGPIAITAHATGGHTPGGTSWTWQSCSEGRCLNFVYADSLTAVSADGFFFTSSKDYPGAVADFEKAFVTIAGLPCDVLVTPHPEASRLWQRLDKRSADGSPDWLIDRNACRSYAENGRGNLGQRLEREKKSR